VSGELEARGGIEPPSKGFADLCLTTWLPRHLGWKLLLYDTARTLKGLHNWQAIMGRACHYAFPFVIVRTSGTQAVITARRVAGTGFGANLVSGEEHVARAPESGAVSDSCAWKHQARPGRRRGASDPRIAFAKEQVFAGGQAVEVGRVARGQRIDPPN